MIGHSLGGLVVQLLLHRGHGAAGVAIHSFPPSGVNTVSFSFVKTMWEGIALFIPSRKTYMVPFQKWEQLFANGMSYDQQKNCITNTQFLNQKASSEMHLSVSQK
jgi:hypothetical protein